MRCDHCGQDFPAGLDKCPRCGFAVHYGGNTEFYGKVVQSKLTFADFFTDVFKKHDSGAGAKVFMAGTPLTTPTPDKMLSEWQKPWLWARVLAAGLLFCIICYAAYAVGAFPSMLYPLLSVGAFVIPISILIFFWEANIPRDIPLYTLLGIFLIGGVISLALVPFIPRLGEQAAFAAFVEEPTKLIALSIFLYKMDKKYIFSGILIGAAVGAGFAVMENLLYVISTMNEEFFFSILLEQEITFEVATETMIMRSILSLGGHLTWAAAYGGALAMVKGNEKLQAKHFADPKFLIYFAASMALHFTWNSDFGIVPLPLVADLKYVILTALAVFSVFTLIKPAITQVLNAADLARFQPGQYQNQAVGPQPGQGGYQPAYAQPAQTVLVARSGPLSGARFPLQKTVTIGRDPNVCNVFFPPDTAGISRRHCVLEVRPDGVYLMDVSSTGTFWLSGARVPANTWVRIAEPFFLGSREVSFDLGQSQI